jgi:hypothetical protein
MNHMRSKFIKVIVIIIIVLVAVPLAMSAGVPGL